MRQRRVCFLLRRGWEAGAPGCNRVQAVRFRATIFPDAFVLLHPPQTGCTSLSGGKRQYHLRGTPSASAPRISFAAVPVRSRGALRPVLPRGRREIHKRGETRPFRPSYAPAARSGTFLRFAKARFCGGNCTPRRAGDVSFALRKSNPSIDAKFNI